MTLPLFDLVREALADPEVQQAFTHALMKAITMKTTHSGKAPIIEA